MMDNTDLEECEVIKKRRVEENEKDPNKKHCGTILDAIKYCGNSDSTKCDTHAECLKVSVERLESILRSKDTNADILNKDKPLICAAKLKHVMALRKLVENTLFNLNQTNDEGETFIMILLKEYKNKFITDREVVDFIRHVVANKKFNINVKHATTAESALFYGVSPDNGLSSICDIDIVMEMIKRTDSDLCQENSKGKTLFEYMLEGNSTDDQIYDAIFTDERSKLIRSRYLTSVSKHCVQFRNDRLFNHFLKMDIVTCELLKSAFSESALLVENVKQLLEWTLPQEEINDDDESTNYNSSSGEDDDYFSHFNNGSEDEDRFDSEDEDFVCDIDRHQMLFELLPKYPSAIDWLYDGKTYLHKVCECYIKDFNKSDTCLQVIKLLLKHAIDVNVQDNEKETALMVAINNELPASHVAEIANYPTCNLLLKNKYGQDVQKLFESNSDEYKTNNKIKSLLAHLYEHQKLKPPSAAPLGDIIKFLKAGIEKAQFDENGKEYLFQQISCLESDLIVLNKSKAAPCTLGMSSEHKQTIIANRVFICEDLSPNEVLTHLCQDKILTDDMFEEINHEVTRRRKVETLLSYLPLRGPNAYKSFLKALRETDQTHIAEALENYDPNQSQPNRNPAGTTNETVPGNTHNALQLARHTEQATFGTPGTRVQQFSDGTLYLMIPINTAN